MNNTNTNNYSFPHGTQLCPVCGEILYFISSQSDALECFSKVCQTIACVGGNYYEKK